MRHEIVGSTFSSSLKLKLVSIAVALFICPATVLGDSLQEAEELGANAILIRQSKMKTSGWTDYPYMQMKADAFVCDSVPEYMAWEIRATR
jgi:hypothetical protein